MKVGFQIVGSRNPAYRQAGFRVRDLRILPNGRMQKNIRFNANVLSPITVKGISPHPIPLPTGERGG